MPDTGKSHAKNHALKKESISGTVTDASVKEEKSIVVDAVRVYHTESMPVSAELLEAALNDGYARGFEAGRAFGYLEGQSDFIPGVGFVSGGLYPAAESQDPSGSRRKITGSEKSGNTK